MPRSHCISSKIFLAAAFATFEASNAGATIDRSVCGLSKEVETLHSTADIALTTSAQLHHVLLGVLERVSRGSIDKQWRWRTGCSEITSLVEGASTAEGCWLWTVAESQVAWLHSSLEEENQEKTPLPNILREEEGWRLKVEDWKMCRGWRGKRQSSGDDPLYNWNYPGRSLRVMIMAYLG